ncbi:hypothetical protein Pst134EB_023830 [Puccinia striiformis f. sp. tritici]|nr:hypothetical protein Pst134EB_023830 [Puccinia striiformis f. sp. tritici]
MIATGTYKPRMKVDELDELALKFDRVTDSENVNFCIGQKRYIYRGTVPLIFTLKTDHTTEFVSHDTGGR